MALQGGRELWNQSIQLLKIMFSFWVEVEIGFQAIHRDTKHAHLQSSCQQTANTSDAP
jgi:hypothetical protein